MPNHETAGHADKLATSVSPYAHETAYFVNAKNLIGWAWKIRLVWHKALHSPVTAVAWSTLAGKRNKGTLSRR